LGLAGILEARASAWVSVYSRVFVSFLLISTGPMTVPPPWISHGRVLGVSWSGFEPVLRWRRFRSSASQNGTSGPNLTLGAGCLHHFPRASALSYGRYSRDLEDRATLENPEGGDRRSPFRPSVAQQFAEAVVRSRKLDEWTACSR